MRQFGERGGRVRSRRRVLSLLQRWSRQLGCDVIEHFCVDERHVAGCDDDDVGVVQFSNAVTMPRSGPSPAMGSVTSRSNKSHAGGCSRSGAVTSSVGPGQFHCSSRRCRIGLSSMRSSPSGGPWRSSAGENREGFLTQMSGPDAKPRHSPSSTIVVFGSCDDFIERQQACSKNAGSVVRHAGEWAEFERPAALSRQRIDSTQISWLGDRSPEEVLRELLGEKREQGRREDSAPKRKLAAGDNGDEGHCCR